MKLLVGGNQTVSVPAEIARKFRPGDSVLYVEATGELLLIPKAQRQIVQDTVSRAAEAFAQMSSVSDEQVSKFFELFAAKLEDESVWSQVTEANRADVQRAAELGRSTTRLEATDKLRRGMIDGLRGWIGASSRRGQVIESIQHDGWVAELIGAELGIVGFVFEGRPNVLADATGVIRGGNTVVFRIGRDALSTAQTMMRVALTPALREAGLPEGAACLIESPEHAAGWALFSDRRLSLAVARGSGPAVATLGSLAQQAGVPVSLHGTGGAWLLASKDAKADALQKAVADSLDRKVCNTLNVCCIPEAAVAELIPAFLSGLEEAGQRRKQSYKLHVVTGSERHLPAELLTKQISVRRARGDVTEVQAEPLPESDLGVEWEWEDTPEVTLKVVADLDEAISLFNRHSPQFVACLVSPNSEEHARFFNQVNAPFVGDGFTRWVDGQFALNRPELGLSNWQNGRLFGRGGVLSGDSVFTVRTRVRRT